MELIADILLIAGALGAAVYCRILAQRLGALKDLDSGLGAAIAALSRQVDELRGSLDSAKTVSGDESRRLTQLAARAEMAAGRLELLLASLHENGRKRPVAPRAARAAAAAATLGDIAADDEIGGADAAEDDAAPEAFAPLGRARAGGRDGPSLWRDAP